MKVTLKDPDNPTLEEVADLCRAALDEILIHGHKIGGGTPVGRESDYGLCLGSALAKPLGMKNYEALEAPPTQWDWQSMADINPCPAGVMFKSFAQTHTGTNSRMWAWNDEHSEEEVLDLLINVEKDLREQAASASTA